MDKVYLIKVITFDSEIYSEEYVVLDCAFVSRSDAETYILKNDLLSRGSCNVLMVPLVKTVEVW